MAHPKLETSCTELHSASTDLLATIKRLHPLNLRQTVLDRLGDDGKIFFENGYVSFCEIDDSGLELTIKVRI